MDNLHGLIFKIEVLYTYYINLNHPSFFALDFPIEQSMFVY